MNVDQVAFTFKEGHGKVLATWNHRRQGRTGRKGRNKNHIATIILTTCADISNQLPVSLVFKGKGALTTEKLDELKAATGDQVHILWQAKAWCDIPTMEIFFGKVMAGWAEEYADPLVDHEHKLMLLDHCGRTHNSLCVKAAIRRAGFLPLYLEAGMTHRLQPVDAGLGRFVGLRVKREYEAWLHEPGQRRFLLGKAKPDAQTVRLVCIRCLRKAMEDLSLPEYDRLRSSCWRHTGSNMTAHGSGELIGMEAHPDYKLPAAGSEVDASWYDERDMPDRTVVPPEANDSSSSSGDSSDDDNSSDESSSSNSSDS